jgi:hypothetical protein
MSLVAVVVPLDRLRQAADYYANLRPNSVVLSGDGTGMVPLYASGTLLVVEPQDFKSLPERNFGSEEDALVTHKIGKHWTLLAEAGRHRRGSATVYFDTNKYWLRTEFTS